MTTDTTAERAAALLLRARGDGSVLSGFPPDLAPTSVTEAYAIQDATLRELGPAGGWKVSLKPDSEPRCAVLPAGAFLASGIQLKVPEAGYEIEVETAFVLARDLSGQSQPLSVAEVISAIGSVHLAIEVCASRFRDRRALPPLSPIADLQSNAAVVLSRKAVPWGGVDLGALPVTLGIGGVLQELPRRDFGAERTREALTWLANHALMRNGGLRAGDRVITGARLGPVPLGPACEIVAKCPGLGEVQVLFSH